MWSLEVMFGRCLVSFLPCTPSVPLFHNLCFSHPERLSEISALASGRTKCSTTERSKPLPVYSENLGPSLVTRIIDWRRSLDRKLFTLNLSPCIKIGLVEWMRTPLMILKFRVDRHSVPSSTELLWGLSFRTSLLQSHLISFRKAAIPGEKIATSHPILKRKACLVVINSANLYFPTKLIYTYTL